MERHRRCQIISRSKYGLVLLIPVKRLWIFPKQGGLTLKIWFLLTERWPALGPTPVRSFPEDPNRIQSMSECPGWRAHLFLGLPGMNFSTISIFVLR